MKLKNISMALLAATFCLTTMLASSVVASESKGIAVALKVTGDVKLKKAGTDRVLPLKFGTVLDNGDWIRTGDDGFVVMIFTDDKSQLKLNARTEVTIEGKRDGAANISKRISLEVGQLLAKVDQQKGTMQIATPTSVASVKGTEFWVIVFDDGSTQVVTLEGLVELLNVQSGRIVDVKPGERGESGGDGNVNVGDTPKDEIPKDPDPGFTPPHTIEVEIQGPDGTMRRVTIEFKEKK